MVDFSFFLDPLGGLVCGRLAVLRWGGQSLKQMHDAAVARLQGSYAGARTANMAERAAFAAIEASHAEFPTEQRVHPASLWRLCGGPLRIL